MAATKCDIIRDMVAATTCGLCESPACQRNRDCPAGQTCEGGACIGRPAACRATLSPAVCSIPGAANAKMALFADVYDPRSLFSTDRRKQLEEADYVTAIRETELGLATAYPLSPPAATNISWPDFQRCLWNPAGQKGGPFNNVYFGRNDLNAFGMSPTYPVGGSTASGVIWAPPKVSPLPVAVDYVANPDLATIVIIVFVLLILVAILIGVARSRKANELTAEDSLTPKARECLEYVRAMEARGYDMLSYRQKCGLGPV